MIDKLNKKVRIYEIIRFVITGGVSFLIDYSFLVLLTDVFKVYYLLSAGISFLISLGINYYICVQWVFDGFTKQTMKSVIIFIIIGLMGLTINQLIMIFCVEFAFTSYKFAKTIAALLVMIWNYYMKRKALVL